MKAVIYCRVSTKDQVLNLSLPTQRKACREYCERHGYTVAREFIEEGESAKTTARTQLQALLTYCRANKGKVGSPARLPNMPAGHETGRIFL